MSGVCVCKCVVHRMLFSTLTLESELIKEKMTIADNFKPLRALSPWQQLL